MLLLRIDITLLCPSMLESSLEPVSEHGSSLPCLDTIHHKSSYIYFFNYHLTLLSLFRWVPIVIKPLVLVFIIFNSFSVLFSSCSLTEVAHILFTWLQLLLGCYNFRFISWTNYDRPAGNKEGSFCFFFTACSHSVMVNYSKMLPGSFPIILLMWSSSGHHTAKGHTRVCVCVYVCWKGSYTNINQHTNLAGEWTCSLKIA